VADTCSGSSAACPDAKSTAVCRSAAGICDAAETCDGASDTCPADAFAPTTTQCRASGGPGDPAEFCSGSSASCPVDGGGDGDGDGVDDGTDNCVTISNPTQSDGDADGLGDACDPCTNLVPVFTTKTKIRVTKQLTPPGDDGFTFKGRMTVPATPNIDPAANGVRVLLTDSTGVDVIDVTIPGGAGWKANPAGNRWGFVSLAGVGGITKVRIVEKATSPGMLKFTVKGKNGSFAVSTNALPVKGTLVIDSPIAMTGQCGEATPPCRVLAQGKTVLCK
jgi:hypothetical protein